MHVCVIFAEIDINNPNWTFLTLKMTFRVIPNLSYFRTGLVSQQKSYMILMGINMQVDIINRGDSQS